MINHRVRKTILIDTHRKKTTAKNVNADPSLKKCYNFLKKRFATKNDLCDVQLVFNFQSINILGRTLSQHGVAENKSYTNTLVSLNCTRNIKVVMIKSVQ